MSDLKQKLTHMQQNLQVLQTQRAKTEGQLQSLEEQRTALLAELSQFGITNPADATALVSQLEQEAVQLQQQMNDLINQLPPDIRNAVTSFI